MADAARSEPQPKLTVAETWRRLGVEQRVEAVGAILLAVSTLGPFSFVEGAILLIAASVLLLLRKRAEGRRFHIPFGDGTMVAIAGVWAGILIFVRLFDRPLGQNLLALACAALLIVAGLRERAKRPPDDLGHAPTLAAEPQPGEPRPAGPRPAQDAPEPAASKPAVDRARYRDETLQLPAREDRPASDRPVPAKVLPPPPVQDDLEDPPAYEGPPRPNRG